MRSVVGISEEEKSSGCSLRSFSRKAANSSSDIPKKTMHLLLVPKILSFFIHVTKITNISRQNKMDCENFIK